MARMAHGVAIGHGRRLRMLAILMAAWCFAASLNALAFLCGHQAPALMGGKKDSRAVARFAGASDVGPGGTTSLMEASHLGNVEAVKNFLADGADINAQDEYGWTALRYAVRGDRYIAAEELIDAGADLNLPSSSGRTPLMSAAANGLDDMVRLLVKSGADLSLKNKEGLTAYGLALRGGPTGSDMIREMVKV